MRQGTRVFQTCQPRFHGSPALGIGCQSGLDRHHGRCYWQERTAIAPRAHRPEPAKEAQ